MGFPCIPRLFVVTEVDLSGRRPLLQPARPPSAGAEQAIRKARAELAADVERAKKELARETDVLAEEIADIVLKRSVA